MRVILPVTIETTNESRDSYLTVFEKIWDSEEIDEIGFLGLGLGLLLHPSCCFSLARN